MKLPARSDNPCRAQWKMARRFYGPAPNLMAVSFFTDSIDVFINFYLFIARLTALDVIVQGSIRNPSLQICGAGTKSDLNNVCTKGLRSPRVCQPWIYYYAVGNKCKGRAINLTVICNNYYCYLIWLFPLSTKSPSFWVFEAVIVINRNAEKEGKKRFLHFMKTDEAVGKLKESC